MELSPNSKYDRRSFLRVLGTAPAGYCALSASRGWSSNQYESGNGPRIDPDGPVRIGMIGREGHVGLVLGELESVPGARIEAYAFEDGDWEFNCDGSRRQGSHDLEPQRKWLEGQPWSASHPRVYETYQEMLAKEQLDIAVVCLPYARNAFAIAEAARSGVHVLSEKPVAVNTADLEMVDEAVAESGVRLSAMFSMRYSSPIFTIRECVSRGAIGKPCLARAQKSYKWGESRPWFYRLPEIYGSTILWVGIHAVDYLRWSTGLEVKEVSGFQENRAHQDYPGAQDSVVLNLLLEGGVPAAVSVDFLRPDNAPTHGDDRLRIAGTEGIVEKGSFREEVELIARGKAPTHLTLKSPERGLFADFVSELKGKGTHLIGPNDAIRVTQICIAATRASETGTVLSV